MTAIDKRIDPARVGLSKSLMTTPCERKGFYGETVRDANGRRLSFPLPERVTFGTAVDDAVAYILHHDRSDEPWLVEDAVRVGMDGAKAQKGWPLVTDPETFEVQVTNAVSLYCSQPDGLARIRALYPENVRLQGDDGRSLRAGDVIGTPDILTDRRVIDVKTWGRNDGERKVWKSPEMGLYAYLFAAEAGAIPETVAYQAYIRVTKPYWTWIEVAASVELVDFGRETAAHWRALLEIGRPELFTTDTTYCGDCPFRQPMPEVGHEGCAVGRLVPIEEKAA
jgi:hypothetical protein